MGGGVLEVRVDLGEGVPGVVIKTPPDTPHLPLAATAVTKAGNGDCRTIFANYWHQRIAQDRYKDKCADNDIKCVAIVIV